MERHDTMHNPVLQNDGSVHCADCGLGLPVDVGTAAIVMDALVVAVGGYGTGFFPEDRSTLGRAVLACTHPTAVAQRDAPLEVPVEVLRVSEEELAAGGEVKPAMPLTEVEKMANRGAFQNFLAMREAVREGMVEQPKGS